MDLARASLQSREAGKGRAIRGVPGGFLSAIALESPPQVLPRSP